ncbi:portal protein [Labrys neptuniae]
MTLTASGRYSQLEGERQPYLDRAREAAKLTIPALMPPDGHTGTTKLYQPFQGIGARGLNNQAAKLLLALFPPNSPFFRLVIDDFTLERMTQRPGMRGEVEKTLNKIERAVQTEIETTAIRIKAFEALKLLICTGNVLLYLMPRGGVRVFPLDRYVVQRDPSGNILQIIVKENVSPSALPLEIQRALPKDDKSALSNSRSVEKTLEMYTIVERTPTKWTIRQEIKGMVMPGTTGWYPLDKCPWIALRWTSIDGESYGRGFVEEHIGDLRSLEALTKAIVEGSAAAAKVLFLVNPGGTTKLKTLTESPSGAVRSGNAQDVSVLQLDKYADFRVALETASNIEKRLSMAFMLTSSVQRAGERVTAEEIRLVASEIDDSFGGVYSLLSQEFQLPLVTVLMARMTDQNRLPRLPKGIIRPAITTGLEALGRGHDLSKLDALVQGIGQTFGPEALAQAINVGEYITRRGTAIGIDMDGLVKTAEDQAAAQQQQMIQMMMEKLGPKGMDILRDQMDPSKQAPDGASPQAQGGGSGNP